MPLWREHSSEYDRAVADYTKAIEIDPKDANAYGARANAYKAKKDLDRAIADYDKATDINPKASYAQQRSASRMGHNLARNL